MNPSYSEYFNIPPLCEGMTDIEVFEKLEKESPILDIELTSGYGLSHEKDYCANKINFFEKLGKKCIGTLLKYYEHDDNIIRVIDYVARIRNEVAVKSCTPESHLFGKSRFEDEYVSVETPFVSEIRQRILWEFLNSYKDRFRNQKVIITFDKFSLYYFPPTQTTGIQFEIISRIDIEDSHTNLVLRLNTSHFPDYKDFKESIKNKAIYSDTFEFIKTEGVDFFDKLQEVFRESLNGNLNAIAHLHWLLARYTPIVRGGGTLAEWISISLLLRIVKFKKWSGNIETWSQASVLPLDQFIENYSLYFITEKK